MKTQSSKDHTQFKFDVTNRSAASIAKLRKSMARHGFIPAHPLHCVKNGSGYYVKDGQHRLEAAKSLGIPVFFVVCENADISIPEINAAQRPWSPMDYVQSFANQGNADYQFLKTFATEHRIPVTVCAAMLEGQLANGVSNGRVRLQSGTFKINTHDIANQVAALIGSLRESIRFATNWHLIIALSKCVLVEQFNPATLIDRVRKHPSLLTLEPTADAFLETLEKVYNHGSRSPIPLRFLASEVARKRNPVKRGSAAVSQPTHPECASK